MAAIRGKYAQVVTAIIKRCGLSPVNPGNWLFSKVGDLEMWTGSTLMQQVTTEALVYW